ncbi:MAG TPA: flavodoxin domain-containing protein [Candidatus Goldiibacteriota bacterium]|nr:flavodoxin domain-containing protein [Candidatus Goldiibacteriota bacterium]HRQ45201.1 flavodoxin domain-containing protein [Candidatus Goldiibacteriota bacterium]
MAKKILVAYGTFSGSTAETAEFIGKKLSEKGMQADVKPVNKIKSVEGYDGVIIGSAVVMGKIKSSVVKFVSVNKDRLSKVSVGYFLVCLTVQKDTPENRKAASVYLEPLSSVVKPVSEGLFPGKVDFKTLRFPMSLLTLMPAFKKGVPEGDYRDWAKIEKWAVETASKF